VYAVYKNAAGNIAYRKYLPEKGWDIAETVPDTSSYSSVWGRSGNTSPSRQAPTLTRTSIANCSVG